MPMLLLMVYMMVMAFASSEVALAAEPEASVPTTSNVSAATQPQSVPASGYAASYDPSQANLSDSERLDQYLFRAAREGDIATLKAFADAHSNLNRHDAKGYTALILAAYNGQLPAVELLLNAGADACAEDNRGNTALLGAIFKGEVSIARRLMAANCKPDQGNHVGQTAVMYAALFGQLDLIADLKARGADSQRQDVYGNSADTLAKGQINWCVDPSKNCVTAPKKP